MLPRGMKLFVADYIDVDTNWQYYKYVVGMSYNSAFNRWYKDTCKCLREFDYYFDEVEDEEEIKYFVNIHENIKAGIYDKY